MNKQLIFVVETSKKDKSDWMYIKETINHYYLVPNTIKLNTVCMNGKTNYASTTVRNNIKKLVNQYKPVGNSNVFYCIDLDDWKNNIQQHNLNQDIVRYCIDNNHDLIWFSRNIEEVYWNNASVHSSDKTRMASKFITSNEIENINEYKLQILDRRYNSSNILYVLDKSLDRKS